MKRELVSGFKLGACVFLLYLAILYWPNVSHFLGVLFNSAMPLAVGCVIAYLLNFLTSLYEKHYFAKSKHSVIIKSRRPVCIAAAIITLSAIVVFVIALAVPQLIDCFQLLTDDLQAMAKDLPAQLMQDTRIIKNISDLC